VVVVVVGGGEGVMVLVVVLVVVVLVLTVSYICTHTQGPTVARALAEKLYGNETYVLGIDSHCHFLRGWDNVGVDMFRRIGNDLAIITSYPASYGANLQRGHGAEAYDVDPTPDTQQSICRTRCVAACACVCVL
jgi:hypothetical protein